MIEPECPKEVWLEPSFAEAIQSLIRNGDRRAAWQLISRLRADTQPRYIELAKKVAAEMKSEKKNG